MNDIERLVAIEEIKQLKGKYCRCIDSRDWDSFPEVFTEDAVMDMSRAHNDAVHPGVHVHQGAADITEWMRGIQALRIASMHHGHTPEIVITSDDTAEGTWAGTWHSVLKPGQTHSELRGAGLYHEKYKKVGGKWRIAHLWVKKYWEKIV